MRTWYYAREGRQLGPVGIEEMRRLVGTGTVQPDDLVWREGMAEWTPAAEIEELKELPDVPPEENAPQG